MKEYLVTVPVTKTTREPSSNAQLSFKKLAFAQFISLIVFFFLAFFCLNHIAIKLIKKTYDDHVIVSLTSVLMPIKTALINDVPLEELKGCEELLRSAQFKERSELNVLKIHFKNNYVLYYDVISDIFFSGEYKDCVECQRKYQRTMPFEVKNDLVGTVSVNINYDLLFEDMKNIGIKLVLFFLVCFYLFYELYRGYYYKKVSRTVLTLVSCDSDHGGGTSHKSFFYDEIKQILNLLASIQQHIKHREISISHFLKTRNLNDFDKEKNKELSISQNLGHTREELQSMDGRFNLFPLLLISISEYILLTLFLSSRFFSDFGVEVTKLQGYYYLMASLSGIFLSYFLVNSYLRLVRSNALLVISVIHFFLLVFLWIVIQDNVGFFICSFLSGISFGLIINLWHPIVYSCIAPSNLYAFNMIFFCRILIGSFFTYFFLDLLSYHDVFRISLGFSFVGVVLLWFNYKLFQKADQHKEIRHFDHSVKHKFCNNIVRAFSIGIVFSWGRMILGGIVFVMIPIQMNLGVNDLTMTLFYLGVFGGSCISIFYLVYHHLLFFYKRFAVLGLGGLLFIMAGIFFYYLSSLFVASLLFYMCAGAGTGCFTVLNLNNRFQDDFWDYISPGCLRFFEVFGVVIGVVVVFFVWQFFKSWSLSFLFLSGAGGVVCILLMLLLGWIYRGTNITVRRRKD